jgi:molybdate transport system substrate-binding protein
MRSINVLACSLLCVAALGRTASAGADVPNVAVAANLNFPMPEIVAAFKQKTGLDVKLAFGASGNFARQIREGAPFELFLSADEANVRMLAEAGRTVDSGRVYAIGRLALFAPSTSRVRVDEALAGLAEAVRGGTAQRVAIANPELAPYGVAAREVLRRNGLWDALQGRIVLGENVNQTAQFALAGGVDAAFIPYSIVVSPNFKGKGRAVLLPESLHDPIVQRMVLAKVAGDTARRLYEFILGSEARAILERYGFGLPPQGA